MEYRIWKHLVRILSHRNDLIDTIKPFFQQLINNSNNQQYNLQDKNHISFLRNLSIFELTTLSKYDIIDKNTYDSVKLFSNPRDQPRPKPGDDQPIIEIIKEDNIEKLKILIMDKGIKRISPIETSFIDVQVMKIPLITECIIQKATKCFKYLLINHIQDVKETMDDKSLKFWEEKEFKKKYKWDCMAVAIYYGDRENVKILEEEGGVEIGSNPEHIKAAILSYRYGIAKEIINKLKSRNERNIKAVLKMSLSESITNNNIKGCDLLINEGADVNATFFIYQNIELLLLIMEI